MWAGDEPGLIAASEPVSGGSLRVRLGRKPRGAKAPPGVRAAPGVSSVQGEVTQEAAPPEPAAPAALFDQIYLLHPKGRRKKV